MTDSTAGISGVSTTVTTTSSPAPPGTTTTTLRGRGVLLALGLALALVCPVSAESPQAELPPPGYAPEGTEEAFAVLRRARSVEHLRLNKYVIPNEEVPLLYLVEDFFSLFGSEFENPLFLKRLGIEPDSPAAFALASALRDYQANQPTEADRQASSDAFAVLVGDPEGWDALAEQQGKARAADTANVVHSLVHELEAVGASFAGIRLFIDGEIRPSGSVTSTEPGGDPEWFERGREFCEISRLPNCVRWHGGAQ